MTNLSQEDIKLLIENSPVFAVRCLKIVYSYQTKIEQSIESTIECNGVGFSGADGEILSSFTKQVLDYESEEKHRYPSPLSPKQMALVVKKLPKYAKQISATLNNEE